MTDRPNPETPASSSPRTTEPDPADLVDTSTQRLKATESAMDVLRARFGRNAVSRGILIDATTDRRRRR